MVEQKLFGITFGVSIGFMSLLTFMLYVDKTGLMLPTFFATLLHEWGHIIMLLSSRCKIDKILFKVGSVAVEGNFVLPKVKECIMLLAGSGINFLFFGICYALFLSTSSTLCLNFGLVSLVVGTVNLLPINGLDGGNILIIFLERFLGEKNTEQVSKVVGLVCCSVIILFGIYLFVLQKKNPSLIIFGIYLLICTFKT
jgi:membrane-associated protease RseP (regulator of RpoE activity)